MNNEFCCSKCADCTEVQSKWKSKQVVQWTSKITDYYNSQFSDKVQMKVYLDKGLLEFAVENAIIDLIRFMEFTKSQSADKHKYGGYF
ncbi:MAG: hypothetical protein LBR30_07160, partial [Clostridioides sp.]|nr:hypothetical protein [Clostridioides sp.]